MDRSPLTALLLMVATLACLLATERHGRSQDQGPAKGAPFVPVPLRPQMRQPGKARPEPTRPQVGFGGRRTVEQFNKMIVDQLFQQTGKRDESRSKSFDPNEWTGVDRFVRIERPEVPVLGQRGWTGATLDILGVADVGEIFAFVNAENVVCLTNPLSQHPDESGLWYQVRLLEGKQGWICAAPSGQDSSPFASDFSIGRRSLAESPAETPLPVTNVSTPLDAMHDAHARGANEGYQAGYKAGYAEAYGPSYDSARKASYSQTIWQIYSSEKYSSPYGVFVFIGFFSLGLAIQYGVIYLLRTQGNLRDIDSILRPRPTVISLDNLSESIDKLIADKAEDKCIGSDPL